MFCPKPCYNELCYKEVHLNCSVCENSNDCGETATELLVSVLILDIILNIEQNGFTIFIIEKCFKKIHIYREPSCKQTLSVEKHAHPLRAVRVV